MNISFTCSIQYCVLPLHTVEVREVQVVPSWNIFYPNWRSRQDLANFILVQRPEDRIYRRWFFFFFSEIWEKVDKKGEPGAMLQPCQREVKGWQTGPTSLYWQSQCGLFSPLYPAGQYRGTIDSHSGARLIPPSREGPGHYAPPSRHNFLAGQTLRKEATELLSMDSGPVFAQ
jgi:hypothetical protein